jgi:predicted transcriptional regulator
VRVREVMSSPVITVPPDMGLKEVADLLVRHGISAVPVVADGELVGIVSEADLVPLELAPDPRAHLIVQTDAPVRLPQVAAEVMTRAVIALPEDADTADAGRLMLERRIKSIPVVKGRRVVGIVARRDLLEVLVRRDQDIAGELEALLAAELGGAHPLSGDGAGRERGPDRAYRLDEPSAGLAAGPRGAGSRRGTLRRGVMPTTTGIPGASGWSCRHGLQPKPAGTDDRRWPSCSSRAQP